MESLPTAAQDTGAQDLDVVETASRLSVPVSTTASTIPSTTDSDADKLFGSGKQKLSGTYIEINCQKGHHYAKRTIFASTGRTRKIPGESGHIGTLETAFKQGHTARVVAFISKHYPNCAYKGVFDKDLQKFGLDHLAPAPFLGGGLSGKVPEHQKGQGVRGADRDETAEREKISRSQDPDRGG